MGAQWQKLILKQMKENTPTSAPWNKGERLIETLKEAQPRDELGRFAPTNPSTPSENS